MQINIENYEYQGVVDEAALIDITSQLAAMAQIANPPGAPWQELTIHLLSDSTIAPVHLAVNSEEGSTDVITQRYDPFPGEPDGLIGEIFVNLECAVRESEKIRSQEAEWSVVKELALYIAHGCDHLNDNEDYSEEGYLAMRARELSWLKQLRLTPVVITSIM